MAVSTLREASRQKTRPDLLGSEDFKTRLNLNYQQQPVMAKYAGYYWGLR